MNALVTDISAERLIRPMQAVRELGLPKTRLYEAIASGEIRHQRMGRSILIRKRDLDAWLDRFTVGGEGNAAA